MSTFTMSSFGDVTVTNGNRVEISDALMEDFRNAAAWLATQPNSTHIGPIVQDADGNPFTKATADLLRKQVRQFAGDSNLSCGFKREGKDAPVMRNEHGTAFNSDTTVTFRFAARRADDNADGTENTEE